MAFSSVKYSFAAAAATAANNSVFAVVTPTGDEFELLHHHTHCNDKEVSPLESSAAFATSSAGYGGHPSFAAFQSLATTASLVPIHHPTGHHDHCELMEAANTLFSMKNLGARCPQRGTVVDLTIKMMSESKYEENENFHYQKKNSLQEGALLRCIVAEDSASDVLQSNSLVHPDRLAIDDDVDEVNKLHQYVRKDLLEIYVVPQISDYDSEDDDDDYDEDYRTAKKSRKSEPPPSLPTTRAAAARRKSFASAVASISATNAATSSSSSSSSTQRHYPGRVGFRCVYCADCRRKTSSKSAFFPLRLTNIYREVCAWQRIHFKTCPMIPESVREKYDHYKMIDTSRGKVRYWETSAKKIGLQNNPDRYDGIIFANTAWRG